MEKTDDVEKYQKHFPRGFCYFIKSSVGSKYDKLELYRGPDAAEEFVKRIKDDCIKLINIMSQTNLPMDLSPNEEKEFEEARIFRICSGAVVKIDKTVCDHCHITEKY